MPYRPRLALEPSPRTEILASISLLQPAVQAHLDEIRALVEREELYGLGCGLMN